MVTHTLDPQVHALLTDLHMDVTGKTEAALVEWMGFHADHERVIRGTAQHYWTAHPTQIPSAVLDVIHLMGGLTDDHLKALGHDDQDVRAFRDECVQQLAEFEVFQDLPEGLSLGRWEPASRRFRHRDLKEWEQPDGSLRIPEHLQDALQDLEECDQVEESRSHMAWVWDSRTLTSLQAIRDEYENTEALKRRLGISADQSDSVPYFSGGSELGDGIALTRGNDILAKLKAEEDEDPRSLDWRSAPKGARIVYRWIMERLAKGKTVKATDLSGIDPTQACRTWLTASPFLILQMADGSLVALGDRPLDRDTDSYPGCPQDVNPLAGRTWGRLLDPEVLAVRRGLMAQGLTPTNRHVARILNEKRHLEGYRYVSVSTVRDVTKRLEEAGELVLVKPATAYRYNHAWVTSAAVYGLPEDYPALLSLHVDPVHLGDFRRTA